MQAGREGVRGVGSGGRITIGPGHVVPSHGWEALAVQSVQIVLEACVGKGSV